MVFAMIMIQGFIKNQCIYSSTENTMSIGKNFKNLSFAHGYGCVNENISQGVSYINNNIDISNCFFIRTSQYSGSGGVIYVNQASFSMNISLSMFYNCASSSNGGAIYFSSLSSFMKMICANSCSSIHYTFAYLLASENNQMDFLSVSYCSTITGIGTVWAKNGKQIFDCTNISMNTVKSYSGVTFESPSELTCSHCSFSNNRASTYMCVGFWYTVGTMVFANIIHNNCPQINYGIVYSYEGSHFMYYCIFDMNQDTLFVVELGSLTVSHCFISHAQTFSTRGSVSTANNNTFTKKTTYHILFFSSHYCNADAPLSTIPFTLNPTPLGTLKETVENTIGVTPLLTPYRSYGDHEPNQSIFPFPTPFNSHFPIQTPFNTHFPVHTPQFTFPPEITPFRSFPLDYVVRTLLNSNDQINSSEEQNKTSVLFIYSTLLLSFLVVVMISYGFGKQRGSKNSNSSSSSKKQHDCKTENNNVHSNKPDCPYVF